VFGLPCTPRRVAPSPCLRHRGSQRALSVLPLFPSVNPIEHRLFPHITPACQGVVFYTVDIVKQLMENAKTFTGLKVSVDILSGIYETGKKCATDFIENMRIVFDEHLPRWNYRALPQGK
jgi:hypothetical protein